MTATPSRRVVGLAVAGGALLAAAGWVVFGSAAGLTVTPKNASAFRSCVLTGYPTTSTALTDSWVDQSKGTNNMGTDTALQVQTKSSSKNTRAYVRFDLTKCVPTVASSATVKKATLRLALATAPASSRTYNLYRATAPCAEGATTCWTENGITWNNQPTLAGSPTSTLALTSSSTLNQYYAFDVTGDVAAMVAGTASNYGWAIADSVENSATAVTVTFKAKNATTNAAGAPQLVVVYSP